MMPMLMLMLEEDDLLNNLHNPGLSALGTAADLAAASGGRGPRPWTRQRKASRGNEGCLPTNHSVHGMADHSLHLRDPNE